MKLTKVSCDQFAGIRDVDISLTDGLNVICGKNESGKSTVVNLISHTLFREVKLDKRSETSKTFCSRFFPIRARDAAYSLDTIDGTVKWESDGGSFSIRKEWSAAPVCELKTPLGKIRDGDSIAKILREELVYGEGVYSDLLLSPQSSTDDALQTILDAAKKTEAKQEITNTLTQALSESGSVSLDELEESINSRISEIEGNHWDAERSAPARNRMPGRWKNGLGSLLEAYYALEDARTAREKADELNRTADEAVRRYKRAEEDYLAAKEKYDRFLSVLGLLSAKNARCEQIGDMRETLEQEQRILDEWPNIAAAARAAEKLEAERSDREALDLFAKAEPLHRELTELRTRSTGVRCPDKSEIDTVEKAVRRVTELENKLCGMNLTAAVTMQNGYSVEIRSLLTGERIELSGERAIREAVSITVPGVMELQLSPADVNVKEVETELHEKRAYIAGVLNVYGVASPDGLKELAKEKESLQQKIKMLEANLSLVLGAVSYENAETASRAVAGTPRSADEIGAAIRHLCGTTDVSNFRTEKNTILCDYIGRYGSQEQLALTISERQTKLDGLRAAEAETENIPAEFSGITDPDGYKQTLQMSRDDKEKSYRTAQDEKGRTEALLIDSASPEELKEAADEAERRFEEQKELLAHWKHIKDVFNEQKELLKAEPFLDLAESFSRCLGIISDGRVVSEFPEGDKLKMDIYSADRSVDYDKLSTGTRETVSLAFRLAVLDHLFPDGGGIIVLDDPFANMDPGRTERSAELVKEAAKRHQVIFLTCREEYSKLLGGNVICL